MSDPRTFYHGKKVLVTGGLGCLGSSLSLELVAAGAQVTIVDSCHPMFGANEHNLKAVRDKVTINVCDIRDADAINHLVKGQDLIFHIGMQTSHVDSMTDPFWDIDINCRGNMVVYEAVRHHNPGCYVIYAGTRGQYGVLEHTPVDETHRMQPTDIYGVNKVAAEGYGFVYNRAYKMPFCSLRVNNCYGPRHQMRHAKYGILNWFIRLAMDGETIKLYGDGAQQRDYNYVDDAIEAFLLAGANQDKCNGEAFNLGSGHARTLREATELIIAAAGKGALEFVPWPDDRKAIETGDYFADFSKFTAATGWQPQVGIEDGLAQTVEFYKANKSFYW
ncbi:NAD-dependent epimerase [bacterium]|nr:MAG: NAD-dependent epimerase [bacterium]